MNYIQERLNEDCKFYMSQNPRERVMMATTRGSVNYGLYSPQSSDTDSMLFVLPSWSDVLLGNKVQNKHIIDSETGVDIQLLDFRNLRDFYAKPSFSRLQYLWAKNRVVSNLELFLEWEKQNALPTIKKNLGYLINSTLGQYYRDRKIGFTPKTFSYHFYAILLLEALMQNEFEFEHFQRFALSLSSVNLIEDVSLQSLKFGEVDFKVFEPLLVSRVEAVEKVKHKYLVKEFSNEGLDEVIAQITMDYLQSSYGTVV